MHYTRGLSTRPIANITRWRALMWQLYIQRTSTCVRYAVNCLPVFFHLGGPNPRQNQKEGYKIVTHNTLQSSFQKIRGKDIFQKNRPISCFNTLSSRTK